MTVHNEAQLGDRPGAGFRALRCSEVLSLSSVSSSSAAGVRDAVVAVAARQAADAAEALRQPRPVRDGRRAELRLVPPSSGTSAVHRHLTVVNAWE